ncbi:1158_t:CDS:2 [Ambispora gerdemannii]|uniref:1158_t:CDS:1 n=1 Tax=Ambispora gerdemannii TaxID=144530 RepID=A0A9N9CZ27_9GLOM|nr:1158_t:CDS:2 [Ambispora gerdemannii]
MPTLHEESGLVFFFYSSDLDEPPHVHIEKPERLEKNNQQPIFYPEEKLETYPSIVGIECTKEEITAFLEDGRKVSIPTD